MGIKYALLGIVIAAIPTTATAGFLKDLWNAGKEVVKEVKKYDDNSRARGGERILSERDRARMDAVTSSGIGGKVLVGVAVATSVYGEATKKDVSSAKEIFDNAITNYNSNNDVIEEKGWNSTPNNSSAINAVYSLGSVAYAKSKEKDIEKANEAFIENNKIYTDPESSYYDPYFYETLKYDKNGRITGRMDTYERINTIKELNMGKNSVEWETIFERTAAKYYGNERDSDINENRKKVEEEALVEMAKMRKENMENYYAGKYNKPQPNPDPIQEPIGKIVESEVEVSLPASIIISGYALNVVDIDATMQAQLDDVFSILSQNPNYKITILGNTCDLGNDRINDMKGEQRAENAKEYLVNKGISEYRIEVVSEGASKPLVENSSVENRRLNRRIEIVFNK